MKDSYIMGDLKKYRKFNSFRLNHHKLFTVYPGIAASAAKEMLTVNGIPKKEKQKKIWASIRKELSLFGMLKLFLDGLRSVR